MCIAHPSPPPSPNIRCRHVSGPSFSIILQTTLLQFFIYFCLNFAGLNDQLDEAVTIISTYEKTGVKASGRTRRYLANAFKLCGRDAPFDIPPQKVIEFFFFFFFFFAVWVSGSLQTLRSISGYVLG